MKKHLILILILIYSIFLTPDTHANTESSYIYNNIKDNALYVLHLNNKKKGSVKYFNKIKEAFFQRYSESLKIKVSLKTQDNNKINSIVKAIIETLKESFNTEIKVLLNNGKLKEENNIISVVINLKEEEPSKKMEIKQFVDNGCLDSGAVGVGAF